MNSKCNRCDNKPVFHVLLEGDENPLIANCEQLCEKCTIDAGSSVIDTWTEKEWDDGDQDA